MSATATRDMPNLTSFGTAEGRWSRLGPYYAMFPVEFAREVIEGLSRRGDTVLDPFCGRGTAPYVAAVAGRGSLGCDINPVAWVYAAVKTDPYPSLADVERRIGEIAAAVRARDRVSSRRISGARLWSKCIGVHQRCSPRAAMARESARSNRRGLPTPLLACQAGAGSVEPDAPVASDVSGLFSSMVAETRAY